MTQIEPSEKSFVLLVEDNPIDANRIMWAFQRRRKLIVIVRNGNEAARFLFGDKTGGGRRDIPSLIVLKLELPGQSGFEILEQIRSNERTRRIPVVVFSAFNETHKQAAHELGADDFCRKPGNPRQWQEAVDALSNRWLSRPGRFIPA